MRNSDPDAAVYWVAHAEDWRGYALHRAPSVRFASEDVGNAILRRWSLPSQQRMPPFTGMPEGNTAWRRRHLLATAPKSNAVYAAYNAAAADAIRRLPSRCHCTCERADHLMNSSIRKGYQYPRRARSIARWTACRPSLAGRKYYRPTDRGSRRGQAAPRRVGKIKEERRKTNRCDIPKTNSQNPTDFLNLPRRLLQWGQAGTS